MPEFEAVGADQPLPDGVLRQRCRSRSTASSTATTAIGRTRTSSRSAAASSPSPGSSCSKGAPSRPTISTRASRSRSSTRPSRASTTATESALGRRFRTVGSNGQQPGPWRTIVGVVSTVRMMPPFNAPNVDESGFYVPFFSNPFGPGQPGAVRQPVRDDRREAARRPARRRAWRHAPPAGRQGRSEPAALLRRHAGRRRSTASSRRTASSPRCSRSSASSRWCWPSVGMYGVMSFSVNQRRQEFGVRMALGAHYSRILQMVLRQGTVQLAIGLVLGLGLALALARLAAPGSRTSSSA